MYHLTPIEFYGSVNSVTVTVLLKSNATSSKEKAALYIGSTYYGSESNLTTSYAEYAYEWTTNPATGLPWTIEDLIDLQAGCSVYSFSSSAIISIDQIYVSVNYTPRGVINIATLRPNGAGDLTENRKSAGANYECVDEETANDDTDYIYQGTSTDVEYQDLYALPSAAVSNILYVVVWIRIRCDAVSNSWTHANLIKTHGSVYRSDVEDDYSSESWFNMCWVWRLNPYTDAQWTQEEIDALQIGAMLEGYAAYPIRCTQIYAKVVGVNLPTYCRPQLIGPIIR